MARTAPGVKKMEGTVTDVSGGAAAPTATNTSTAQYLVFGAVPVTRVARTEFVKSVFSIVT